VLDWQHVDLLAGGAELAGDEEGRKPGGSWRLVPLITPLRALLHEDWLEQGEPRKGRFVRPTASARAVESQCEARKGEFGVAGRQAAWSRLACRRQGTLPPPGWTMPASRRRFARKSWVTRRRSISPAQLGSPSSAIPTCCQASWSMPASASTGLSMSEREPQSKLRLRLSARSSGARDSTTSACPRRPQSAKKRRAALSSEERESMVLD
jgi:hypothetical protein